MNLKCLLLKTLALSMGLYLTSCVLEPYVIPAEEMYTRNFIKKFGLIDPEQDWNLSQAADVTVDVGNRAKSVKVYCKVNTTYYIVADLKNVRGSVKIPVDVPQNTTDLMVKIDGVRYYTTVGGSVSRHASRSIADSPDSNEDITISWADPILFNVMQVSPIITDGRWMDYVNGEGQLRKNDYPDSNPLSQGLIPEGHNGSGLANYTNPYVVKDFYFYGVDAGKTGSDRKGITIYPMYWQTSSTHVVGLYYFVDGDGNYVKPGTEGAEMRTVEIFTDKNSDEAAGSEQLRVSNSNLTTYTNCGKLSKGASVNTLIMNANGLTNESQIPTLYKTDSEGDYVEGEMWSTKYKYLTEEACLNIVNYLKNQHEETEVFDVDQRNDYTYGEIFNCFAQVWDDGIDLWFNYTNNYSAAGSHLAYTPNQDCAVIAKGINIKVPSDMYFGLYICTVGDTRYGNFYSQKEFNTSEFHKGTTAAAWQADEASEEPVMSGKPFAATYKHQSSGRQFFSFEDACDKTDDWDLNDIVFRMDGNYQTFTTDTNAKVVWATKETNESEAALTWLIAAEDLGATDDFDFNDVIFQVQSITTNYDSTTTNSDDESSSESSITKKVVVQALAAGGTLPIYLHFDTDTDHYILGPNNVILQWDGSGWTSVKNDYKDIEDCEWHRWFGNFGSTTMINTGIKTVAEPYSCEITDYLDLSDFTLSNYSQVYEKTTTNKKIRGFYITVGNDPQPSSEMSDNIGNNIMQDSDSSIINGDAKGEAPQMFLIPDLGPHEDAEGVNLGWYWPDERTSLTTAYTLFSTWVGSANNTNWHKHGTGIRPAKGIRTYEKSSSTSTQTGD